MNRSIQALGAIQRNKRMKLLLFHAPLFADKDKNFRIVSLLSWSEKQFATKWQLDGIKWLKPCTMDEIDRIADNNKSPIGCPAHGLIIGAPNKGLKMKVISCQASIKLHNGVDILPLRKVL